MVNLAAYRTTELRLAHPDRGFGDAERHHWQYGEAWQGLRRALETSLIAYDFGEALTAANLVVRPTVEHLLYHSMGQTAKANGDDLTWLLLSSLAEDAERLGRWSSELAKFCVAQRHENSEVLQRWVRRWEPRADAAAAGLATAIAALNGAPGTADDLLDAARCGTTRSRRSNTRPDAGMTGWHDAYDEAELWEDDMVGVDVAGEPVLLIRDASASARSGTSVRTRTTH